MPIDVRIDDDVAVIVLSERLTLGESCDLLRETIDDLLAKGYSRLVLDLTALSYLDSAGVGEIVRSFTKISRRGGSMRWVGEDKLKLAAPGLVVLEKMVKMFRVDHDADIPDPLNPQLHDVRWELQVAVALAVLVIIGVLIALR